MTPDGEAETYIANQQMWGDLARPEARRAGNGEWTLTVYGPFTGMLLEKSGKLGEAAATAPLIVFNEDMLVRGIVDGTLYEGIFNEYRTRPPFVCDWPEEFQDLKTEYGKQDIGHNEPF